MLQSDTSLYVQWERVKVYNTIPSLCKVGFIFCQDMCEQMSSKAYLKLRHEHSRNSLQENSYNDFAVIFNNNPKNYKVIKKCFNGNNS